MALDLVALALTRITGQFYNSPKLLAALEAIIAPLNVAELDLDDLKTKRWLDTAFGVQLDGLGSLVGERREGRDDETYREALRFRVFINTSQATPPDIMFALRYLTKSDNLQYLESYPATFYLYCDGYSITTLIPAVMQDLSPAAVANVTICVSYGHAASRTSGLPALAEDDSSELGGMVASMLNTVDGRQLKTISGKRIRIRSGYKILPTKPTFTGLFQ